MSCGFYLSLLGKPGGSLPDSTDGSEPLVNAIYAWQQTFINNFQELHDTGEAWQVLESSIKRRNHLVETSAYYTTQSLGNSPTTISQIVESLWRSVYKIYNFQPSQITFEFDPATSGEFSPVAPDFSKYHGSAQWTDTEVCSAQKTVSISVTSDAQFSLEVASQAVDFISSCGISVICDTQPDYVCPENTGGALHRVCYQVLISGRDSICVSWLLACLVAVYFPSIKATLTISIDLPSLLDK